MHQLFVSRLTLTDFRNHAALDLELDGRPLSSTVGSEAWNSRDLKSRPH